MDNNALNNILALVASGELSPRQAAEQLRLMPYEDMDYVKIDTGRKLRTGHGEVIFSIGKTPEQVAGIMKRMSELDEPPLPILATKAERSHFTAVHSELTQEFLRYQGLELSYHEKAKLIAVTRSIPEKNTAASPAAPKTTADSRRIAVVSAGTADIPIAEEAAITAELYGHTVVRIYDVGVAGIHRLLDQLDAIRTCSVVIVIAGMEGALASVLAGLVSCPVIAVPTSVGYGVTLDGLTPLFAMLSGCSLGVSVMNIDNGFGAGHFASMILELVENPGRN